MDTAAYEKLLSELEIPSEWNAENKEALLDQKYSEALELLDVAQQNGEEDKIARLDDRIRKIEDALEYTKKIEKRLSSGLVLNTQSDKDRLDELKEAGKKEETQTVKQLETTSQTAANTPIPQPSVSTSSASSLLQSQMRRAKMELEDENWNQAERLYHDILNAEPKNAEANLGLFMASQKIREKEDIPEAAKNAMKDNRDIFQDKQFLRTRQYADERMKKELADYEKDRDYLIAVEKLHNAKTNEEYRNLSEVFGKLGNYKSAPEKKKACDSHWQKPLYDASVQAMKRAGDKEAFEEIINNFDKLGDYEDAREQRKQAAYLGAVWSLKNAKDTKDVSGFSAAKKMFEELGDYADSKEKLKECEEGIKELPKLLQRQLESYGKYKQEYKNFEERFADSKEIRKYESKIRSRQTKIDSLQKTPTRGPLRKRWIFLIAGLLFCFFMSVMANRNKPMLVAFVEVGVEIISFFVDGFHGSDLEYAYSEFAYNVSHEPGILFAIVFLAPFVVPFVITFIYWVRHHMKKDYDEFIPACFRSLWKAVLISSVISALMLLLVYLCTIFEKQVQMIGTVALIIAVLMILDRITGKIMVKFRSEEIKRLQRRIDDDYRNIERTIGTEYQKIYDRYPDAGAERKAVSEVQSLLMDTIKKRNGAGQNTKSQAAGIVDAKASLRKKLLIGVPILLVIIFVMYWNNGEKFSDHYEIEAGTEEVVLNCENLKELTIPDSVAEMTLLGLKDELALTLELPEHLKTLHIEQSPDLTDIGFQDIEIPESVRDLSIEGDNLENIDIPVDLDSLTIGGAENLTVNVSGNVLDLKVVHAESLKSLTVNVSGYVDQLFDFSAESAANFESLKNLTVNVSGCVNDLNALSEENITVDVSGEMRSIDALCKENLTVNVDGVLYYCLDVTGAGNFTVNGNGTVHDLMLDTGYGPDYPEMKNVTVNAKIDICKLTMWFSEERGESIPHIEFSEVPKALQLDYNAENELIIPEGAELLKLYWESEEVPVIPDSVRYLSIVSDTLDFGAVNIPEGILYYKLISSERNEQREYQDENCPDALAHFDFNDLSADVPDLSGL